MELPIELPLVLESEEELLVPELLSENPKKNNRRRPVNYLCMNIISALLYFIIAMPANITRKYKRLLNCCCTLCLLKFRNVGYFNVEMATGLLEL